MTEGQSVGWPAPAAAFVSMSKLFGLLTGPGEQVFTVTPGSGEFDRQVAGDDPFACSIPVLHTLPYVQSTNGGDPGFFRPEWNGLFLATRSNQAQNSAPAAGVEQGLRYTDARAGPR